MSKKSNIDCLKGAIGLSAPAICPAPCVPSHDLPEIDSGLYLDGYDEGAVNIADLFECFTCDVDKIWENLDQMCMAAMSEFLRTFDTMLTTQKTSIFKGISTTVGDYQKSTGPWVTSEKFAVGKITPKNCVDGFCMRINEINLWMVGAPSGEEFEVFLYSDRDLANPIDSVNITVSPKGGTAVNWTLPLSDNQGDICYYLVYDKKGYQPKDTKWNCGCSGSVRKWEQRLIMSSCTVNTIGELEDFSCSEEYSAGLSFNASIRCDALGFLCGLDFSCGYGLQVARAIQLIFRRMAASHISTFGIKQAAQYGERYPWYQENIEWNMQWLVQEYSSSFSGCYVCDDGADYSVENYEV